MWMKLTKSTNEGFTKQLLPEGMVNAICYSIVDLWTQESKWEWQTIKQRKIQITFETDVEGEFDGEKKPLIVGKRYTFSSNEKSRLFIDLKSWFNKPVQEWFDIMELVGKPAQLQIMNSEKDGKTYQNINTIIKADKTWKLYNDTVKFNLEEYDSKEFDKIPEWMKEIIKKSPEWEKKSEEIQDDLPF